MWREAIDGVSTMDRNTVQILLSPRRLPLRLFGIAQISFLVAALIGGCTTGGILRFLTWKPEANQPMDQVSEQEGAFRAKVDRQYASEAENKLLTLVEATYPLYPHSIILPGLNRSAEEPGWWLSTAGGIRIPVMATRGSVEYLLKLVRAFRAGDFSEVGGVSQKEAVLVYSADIEPAESALEDAKGIRRIKELYLVRLELEWTSDCGPRCGLHFTRARTAVIQRDGKILELLEDPLPSFTVE